MEDQRSSHRPAAKSAYGDVFGAPSKFSAGKSSDYAEIFGGFASSCSIPFLNLPPTPEAPDGVGFIDYSEIFGGINYVNFGVDYEDLFGVGKKAAKSSSSTLSDKRPSVEAEFGQQAEEVSNLSTEDVTKGKLKISTHNLSYNGWVNHVLQGKMAPPSSSADNIKSYGAELGMSEKNFGMKFTASKDEHLNVKHHSPSSSNYSPSSGDHSYPNVTYVGVSDINLQTQPSRVPPPSRTPPKLFSHQENNKMKMYRDSRADQEKGSLLKHSLDHQIHYKVGAPKSHGHQGRGNDTLSRFFDVEEDASSAAAAMKAAMEQAQAKLKSAKELMEKKRENLQSFRKLGHRESTALGEKESKASEVEMLFQDEMAEKPLLKEEKKMKESALYDTKKAIKVGEAALDHGEREISVISAEESRVKWLENGVKLSKIPSKLEEAAGEWKMDKQFYELVNNDTKFRVVKEAFKLKVVENESKLTTEVDEDLNNYSEQADTSCESMVGQPDVVYESSEIDDNYSKFGKTPNTIRETRTTKKNAIKLDEDRSSYHQKETEKRPRDQESIVCGRELDKPYAGEEASIYGESENNVESFNDASEVHIEYSKSQAASQACEHDEPSGTILSFLSFEAENKMNIFQGKDMQDGNENEKNVRSKTCIGETGEVIQVEEAHLHEISENTKQQGSHQPFHEENECMLEGFVSTSEQEASKKLCGVQEVCMQVKNNMESGAAQDNHEVKPNSEGLKPAVGIILPSETGNKMTSKREACWSNSNGIDTLETHVDNLRYKKTRDADQMFPEQDKNANKKNEDADQMPLEQESGAKSRVLEGDHQENEIGKLQEANENFIEKLNILDEGEKVCQRTESNDPRDVDHAKLSAKKEKLEAKETTDQEREDEKEKARKAQEKKERERERVKDRLAVERASREVHERALAEAREGAERISAERITADARQRAFSDSRKKAEKAAAEALEKKLIEKALKEAKLRAERAAAERAIAEARERAVEKAVAEKATADARQLAEGLNSMSRDNGRKENESGDFSKASDKEDREIKLKRSSSVMQDVPQDARFPNAAPSSNSQRKVDSYVHVEGESSLRCKARLERHQRTVERAAKALAEKNMRDVLAQREQAERNRLAESLDADVRRWSAGKEGNLRALLSTLQYILGPESGWQPIPLTDVITAAAVKKAYRKATLYVHPDKLQQRGASIQQKYICEKVFDLLKDAWNRFNSEER